jgi:hypothetical protein
MTNAELAELRGEIFGLKVLLFNCLSFIAGQTSDPATHLAVIKEHAIAGIVEAKHSDVRPQHLPMFRNAAAGIVAQAIEAANSATLQGSPRPRLQ